MGYLPLLLLVQVVAQKTSPLPIVSTQHMTPDQFTMNSFLTPDAGWYPMDIAGPSLDMLTPEYPMKDSIPHIHYTDHDVGAVPMVQTFYEGPPKCDCCSNWIEKAPTQLPEAAKERYDEASIQVFKIKDHESHSARIGGLVAVKSDTIELQGKVLVNFLRPILAEVGFIAPLKTKIIFKAPFRELYFAHRKIVEAAANLHSTSGVRRHVEVLVTAIQEIFADTVKQVTDLLSRHTITFEHLWTLFPRHKIVYSKDYGGNRVFEVATSEYIDTTLTLRERAKNERPKKPDLFKVKCSSFMFDGTNFGPRKSYEYVDEFKGVRRITSFNVYPLEYHSNPNVGHEYSLRGKKILDMQGMIYCCYNGPTTKEASSYRIGTTRHVAGRVIVDPYGARKFMSEDGAKYVNADEFEVQSQTEDFLSDKDPSKSLPRIKRRGRRPNEEEKKRNREFLQANPQHLITMNPRIEAYSLSTNEWILCDMDYCEPIKWNAAAFDHLVLDQDYKDILGTFSRTHDETSGDDTGLIAGKGHGLIVLLSGLTGTGKTLTVEAVADNLKRPLFRLQPDRLGSSPESIGKKLTEAFDLAIHWKAVLLLDEADSLLSKRSLEGGVRNEVVSVMLRHLEYYKGIMFMTTNLFDNIDHAVRSRVRIHIQYQALSAPHRLNLWKTFLAQSRIAPRMSSSDRVKKLSLDLSENDWEQLAAWKLNGREIENVAKNAIMWCGAREYTITVGRLEKLIPLTTPFAEKETVDSLSESESQIQPRKRARIALD